MQRYSHPRWMRKLLVVAILVACAVPAQASSTTWYVTSAGDGDGDGDITTHRGSLRWALGHASSGDFVSFDDYDTVADTIFVERPLKVPSGVAVGRKRSQACGSYGTPLANIEAQPLVEPVFSLGAGSTLRGIDVAGGTVSLEATGADVDVCGVGLGLTINGDGNVVTLPPRHATLIVDGPRATIQRSYLSGPLVVTENGSDTLIGDELGGSGNSNAGVRAAAVTIYAGPSGAARRVTVRDPFPRALAGMAGSGIAGGDDDPAHANNWAQTPSITSAGTADDFASVQVQGVANPLSLVDVYFDDQLTVTPQTPVLADETGAWSFSGALPGRTVQVIAASTLNDPAHPDRAGSSSQWSPAVTVVAGTPPPMPPTSTPVPPAATPEPTATPVATPTQPPGEPLLSALGGVTNLNDPNARTALTGDVLRLTIAMTNAGTVDVTRINSTGWQLPAGFEVVEGSAALQGDSTTFIVSDAGFSDGTLAPGASALYTLDVYATATAQPGTAVFAATVNADGIVSIPVVARIRIEEPPYPAPLAAPGEVEWLPLVFGWKVLRALLG